MADQQIQNNIPDDLDEVLVKEPDGTFRVVKVASVAPAAPVMQNATPGVVSTPGVKTAPVRVEKPAPSIKILDTEEEKEFAAVVEKTKTIAPATERDTTDDLARRALSESGVALADPALQNRLSMIMIAYMKNVRDDLETRELLMRPKDQGGIGMNMSEAIRLLSFLKTGGREVLNNNTTPGVVATPGVSVSRPVAPPITNPPVGGVVTGQAPAPTLPPPAPKFSQSENLGGQAPITKLADGGSRLPAGRQVVTERTPVTPKPVVSPAPVTKPPSLPPQEVTRPQIETKPIMQDVTFTPTLMGPVDELRMNLVDWRRMSPTVKDRAAKVEEKLKLLEEESFAERVRGITAWYASDVVRLYQEIGQESLTQGKSIAAIVTERQNAGKPILSQEEFQSIAELNERIRF